MDEQTEIVKTFRGNDLALIGNIPSIILTSFTHQTNNKVTYFYPRDFFVILRLLQENSVTTKIDFSYDFSFSSDFSSKKNFQLYDFQKEAIHSWISNERQGII